MSAIFGVLRSDGGAVEERALEAMARVLAHRGPDGSRVLALDNAGLGHCLMRVTCEDQLEAQPLHDPFVQPAALGLVGDCLQRLVELGGDERERLRQKRGDHRGGEEALRAGGVSVGGRGHSGGSDGAGAQ